MALTMKYGDGGGGPGQPPTGQALGGDVVGSLQPGLSLSLLIRSTLSDHELSLSLHLFRSGPSTFAKARVTLYKVGQEAEGKVVEDAFGLREGRSGWACTSGSTG